MNDKLTDQLAKLKSTLNVLKQDSHKIENEYTRRYFLTLIEGGLKYHAEIREDIDKIKNILS